MADSVRFSRFRAIPPSWYGSSMLTPGHPQQLP